MNNYTKHQIVEVINDLTANEIQVLREDEVISDLVPIKFSD